eukprot:3675702-Alexandrium_andersonii.AAC.1
MTGASLGFFGFGVIAQAPVHTAGSGPSTLARTYRAALHAFRAPLRAPEAAHSGALWYWFARTGDASACTPSSST